jgi:hypothetical protein
MNTVRTLAVAAALTLVAAGCGDDAPTDTGDLPVNTGDVGDVSTEPACAPDEPDCDDTIDVSDDDVQDLPDGSSSGMTVDGGLTVDDALTRGPADGIIAVKGSFFRDDNGAFLCGALAESMPPQCGEPRIQLDGAADEAIGAPIQEAQGIEWTDELVTVFGTMADGVLTIDGTVMG